MPAVATGAHLSAYRIPARCHVCGLDFLARYNVGDRAKVCTPPGHVCKSGRVERNGEKKRVRCIERCCRSRYQRAAAATMMDNAIDPRKVLSPTQLDAVLAAIRNLDGDRRMALWFLAVTGARLGESALVRVGDLEWSDGPLSVVRVATLKREGRPVRSVHLDNVNPFVKELQKFVARRPATDPLFTVHRRVLQRALERILAKHKPDRASLVHILRHTRASQLVNAGAPWSYVAQQMGWASLEMAKVYAHTNADEIAKIHERMR